MATDRELYDAREDWYKARMECDRLQTLNRVLKNQVYEMQGRQEKYGDDLINAGLARAVTYYNGTTNNINLSDNEIKAELLLSLVKKVMKLQIERKEK